MPLILAIEPDKRQSSQLASIVKGLHAELVLRANAADALEALNGRIPDLVLTTSLISPRDDAALATRLRELGSAAAHVQTVSIPLLGSAAPKPAKIGGMLAALRREKPQAAPMTDGCAPEVFAEQVRQYLATADEQKAAAAIRAVASPSFVEPIAEPVLVEDAATEAAFVSEFAAPAEDLPAPFVEPEPLVFEPEPVALEPEAVLLEAAPVIEEVAPSEEPIAVPIEERPVVAGIDVQAAAPETSFLADEPASVQLSQLLEFASAAETVLEAPVVEPEPAIETAPDIDVQPASAFDDLYVDPVAAEALEELSRQAPAASLSDGIPAEAPVPVVEMHSFQSLDAIASELAAGPTPRHESLDDLASFFAATPAKPAPVVDLSAPTHGEKSLFASLFADPAPARAAKPAEIPDVDPSLFASPAPAPAPPAVAFAAPEPIIAFEAPAPEIVVAPEPVASELIAAPPVEPSIVEEAAVEEAAVEDELITFEPVVFEPVVDDPAPVAAEPAAVAAAVSADLDEEIALDVDAFEYTPPAPPAPAAPAEPARFTFTLVEGGFGDALNDFEVPSVAAVAADLGVGEHLPLDPYASKPAPAPAAVREALNQPAAAPALDEEALSLIGDAARKVGLDALVIEEFERSLNQPRAKKAKKKVHAGATQVPAAPAPAPKPAKRPVQDEWGMFDPEQCGFAALDEEEGADARPASGTRVRVISY